jgi:hypothetical protein
MMAGRPQLKPLIDHRDRMAIWCGVGLGMWLVLICWAVPDLVRWWNGL